MPNTPRLKIGQIKNGPCDDPDVQQSHIDAILAIAEWVNAATSVLNSIPERQIEILEKVNTLCTQTGNNSEQQNKFETQIASTIQKIKATLYDPDTGLVAYKRKQEDAIIATTNKANDRLWRLATPILRWGLVAVVFAYGYFALNLLNKLTEVTAVLSK
jgi:hypothetical protein